MPVPFSALADITVFMPRPINSLSAPFTSLGESTLFITKIILEPFFWGFTGFLIFISSAIFSRISYMPVPFFRACG